MTKLKEYFEKYNTLKEKSEKDKTEIKTLEKIILAIQGLKKTKKEYQETERAREKNNGRIPLDFRAYDPGKYDTAYFYAKFANENWIVASKKFIPRIYNKCPDCGRRNPVLVRYEQTEDSLEGDTWEADAFAICCNKIRTIKHLGSDCRFLHFE